MTIKINGWPGRMSAAAACLVVGAWSSGTAQAADPVQPDASFMAPVPEPLWDGMYIGVSVGGSLMHSAYDPSDSLTETDGSFIAGAQVGWNWQVNDLVLGLEIDAMWTDMEAGDYSDTHFVEVESISSIRGRLGIPMGNYLPYATMGVGMITGFAASSEASPSTEGNFYKLGFIGGLGLEMMINDQFSAKVEGLVMIGGDVGPGVGASDAIRVDPIGLLRIGLNYHF